MPEEMQPLASLLHQQHAVLLQRLGFQDNLLRQVLMEVPHTQLRPAAPVVEIYGEDSAVFDGTIGVRGASKDSVPRESQEETQISEGVTPTDKDGWARKEDFQSLELRQLRSYSKEDLELKHEAEVADADFLRKMFSRNSHHHGQLKGIKGSCLQNLVGHPGFDMFFACVVVTNAIFIGFDVERSLGDPNPRPLAFQMIQSLYTVLFCSELALRFAAYGVRLFCSEDWAWVLMDTFIVLISIWETVVDILQALEPESDELGSIAGVSTLKAFRVVRLTRLLKIAQVVRIFRFVIALRTLVQSIFHTLKALLWALLLLLLIVFVFSVLIAQAISDFTIDLEEQNLEVPPVLEEEGRRYFGNLPLSMLSLFMSIAGGVSWEEVLKPLLHVSSLWALCFIFYICFTYFAVLNVVTAVFCQSAIESAQKDHATVVQNMLDNKESHLQKLRTLFSKMGAEEAGGITFGMFEEKINSQAVREYFETLGLDVWDPWSFFKLLDSDGGGFVEVEEFFLGCLRFSGAAKAMDVGKLIQDQTWLIRSQGRFQRYMEDELCQVKDGLTTMADVLSAMSRGVSCTQL